MQMNIFAQTENAVSVAWICEALKADRTVPRQPQTANFDCPSGSMQIELKQTPARHLHAPDF